jgi:hypothetical protein
VGIVVVDHELVRELLTREAVFGGDSHQAVEPRHVLGTSQAVASGERVLQQLQEYLTRWFGPEGVDALLIRALDLTRVAHPVMAAVPRHGADRFRLSGIVAASSHGAGSAGSGVDSSTEGVADAIAEFIGTILALIGRLVGDDMTRRLVRQIWPEISSEVLPPPNGSDNEKVGK